VHALALNANFHILSYSCASSQLLRQQTKDAPVLHLLIIENIDTEYQKSNSGNS
jgi:hypothetical protein